MLADVKGAKTEWRRREADEAAVRAVADAQGLPEPVARVLVARGHATPEDARAFLEPRLSSLPDPGRLKGMPEAVERVADALSRNERVGIFGDYDVDGVTSTTLLWDFLEQAGGDVVATLPDRMTEGYGLSRAGVDRLRDAGATLIVTVDCGVTAHEEVKYCKGLGLDVIVIDHHTVPVTLPEAVAVINPHRPDCERGAEHLCAVGVTFNLCLALRRALRERGRFGASLPEPDLKSGLDLVALGTVADVVPLVGENRVFVAHGLHRMRRSARAGVRALLDVAGVERDQVTSSTLGFQLGPRINAAGRLGDAMKGVDLLRTRFHDRAHGLAERLNKENLARRDIEKRILEEAIQQVESSEIHREARVLVVGDEAWHPGVVGIVASRLVDRYGKPAVVIGEAGRGSGRSIPRFHLHEGLVAVQDTLEGFGGHAHAAGVRIPAGGIGRFRDALAAHAADKLTDDDLRRLVLHDGPLDIEDVDVELLRRLATAAPWGRGNPEPVFVFGGVRPRGLRELKGGHFKANIHPRKVVDAVCFGAPERMGAFEGSIDVVGAPDINHWKGRDSVQVRVRDFRATEAS
jgi:single-stranded-DNA-specific exonuclease